MSDSIHTTGKDLRNLTKMKIEEMSNDPLSVLRQFGIKSNLKKRIKKERKEKRGKL